MIHLGTTTTDSPVQVIEKAFDYFGPNGVGLRIARREPDAIQLEGGGGHVQITACAKGSRTEVDIQSREWQRQALEFLGRL
jgi:hypothetical protein